MAIKLINKEKIERNKNQENLNKNFGNRKFNIDDYNKDRGKRQDAGKKSKCC